MADRPSVAILAETVTAAICHSTNWDLLHGTVMAILGQDSEVVSPKLSYAEFEALLGPGISGSQRMDRRADLEDRHRLLIDVLKEFSRDGLGLETGSKSELLGRGGFMERLATISAFREDPERKKLRILAQNLQRSSLVNFADINRLEPAIEYHIIRLYIRTGRVSPTSRAALESLNGQAVRRIDSVNALRKTVSTALKITADAAELDRLSLNDLEWQIGRSYCVREGARCAGPVLPNKSVDSSLQTKDGGCPLRGECAGFQNVVPQNWVEPQTAPQYGRYY